MAIPLLASSPQFSEASQIIPTVNGLINSINTQTLIGSSAPTSLRNLIIGGDFTTNPWARGTSFTGIANTTTYTADRFWARGGASSSISVSRGSTSPPPGFNNYLQFGRASSNSDTAVITLGTVSCDLDSIQMQGQPFVLSFWALAGSNFSAANSALTVKVGSGTAQNGTPQKFVSTGWTGFTNAQLSNSAGNTSTVTLTTSFQRFALAGVLPVNELQVGVSFSYAGVGTAGANDFIQITGIQLEVAPLGGVSPTPFERRPIGMELALCQRYCYVVPEPISSQSAGMGIQGTALTTTTAKCTVPYPVPMRAAPGTTTFPTDATGNWGAISSLGSTSATITTTISVAGITSSLISVTGTTFNAGQPVIIAGAGGTAAGTNIIVFSSEL